MARAWAAVEAAERALKVAGEAQVAAHRATHHGRSLADKAARAAAELAAEEHCDACEAAFDAAKVAYGQLALTWKAAMGSSYAPQAGLRGGPSAGEAAALEALGAAAAPRGGASGRQTRNSTRGRPAPALSPAREPRPGGFQLACMKDVWVPRAAAPQPIAALVMLLPGLRTRRRSTSPTALR